MRGERMTSGRYASAYLRLAAWGPYEVEAEYAVPRAVHDGVSIGDSVCVDLHPGALRARWYVIHVCE